MKTLAIVLAAVSGLAFAAPVSAAPFLTCSTGNAALDLIAVGCISRDGDGFFSQPGDTEAKVEQAIFQATGRTIDLTLYGKSDDNPGLFSFSPGDPATAQSGTWDVLNNNVLIKFLTVKAAAGYALFEFAGAGVNSGSFSTAGLLTSNGKNQPNVSHMSFWTAPVNNPDAIPEPATWAMMLGGFGLAGAAMRRRGSKVVFA